MKIAALDLDALHLYTVLADGGLALVRTNTGYGLVAMKADAVRRIYALKGREAKKPCVTVGSMDILSDVATDIDGASRNWLARATKLWPLAVIAMTNRSSTLLRGVEPFVVSQCTREGTIATFFGVGDLVSRAAEIAREHGRLVVGSSANIAGTGNNYTLDAVPAEIRRAVDLELDYGPAPFQSASKEASTILDLTRGTFQRRGAAFEQIEASWNAHLAEHEILRAA